MAEPIKTGEFVQSLERGLAVIRAFDVEHPELTLSEVARETGLPRAVARRFLHTLVTLGYVRSSGRHFALRPRILELGYAYLSSLSLPDVAEPHMESLVERIRESCSLVVLDETDIVYVARVPTRRIMRVAISVGTRFPAAVTSTGRVLLAHQPPAWLDEHLVPPAALTPWTVTDPVELRARIDAAREQGHALVDQELEEGLRALAVPIRGVDGQVVAAMNVSVHTSRGSAEVLVHELLPELRVAADLIEDDLGGARRTPRRPGEERR